MKQFNYFCNKDKRYALNKHKIWDIGVYYGIHMRKNIQKFQ